MSQHTDGGGVLGASSALPFTGSILTLPILILGLVLTVVGWALRRLRPEP